MIYQNGNTFIPVWLPLLLQCILPQITPQYLYSDTPLAEIKYKWPHPAERKKLVKKILTIEDVTPIPPERPPCDKVLPPMVYLLMEGVHLLFRELWVYPAP